jgi:hypothetical protein
MPGPPGSGVTNPARRNRTRSVSRCVSRSRPFGERDFPTKTEIGIDVKDTSLYRRQNLSVVVQFHFAESATIRWRPFRGGHTSLLARNLAERVAHRDVADSHGSLGVNGPLIRRVLYELRNRQQISGCYPNHAATRTVNICNKEERD